MYIVNFFLSRNISLYKCIFLYAIPLAEEIICWHPFGVLKWTEMWRWKILSLICFTVKFVFSNLHTVASFTAFHVLQLKCKKQDLHRNFANLLLSFTVQECKVLIRTVKPWKYHQLCLEILCMFLYTVPFAEFFRKDRCRQAILCHLTDTFCVGYPVLCICFLARLMHNKNVLDIQIFLH